AFGTIVRQLYTLSGRRVDFRTIPQLTFQEIGLRDCDDEPGDPGTRIDHPQAAALWERLRRIYHENYEDDPAHANRWLERFPQYLRPRLRPSLYFLYFSMDRSRATVPEDLVAFVRFTDVTPVPDDGKKYRYIGALNVDKRFHGYQLHQPFLQQCCARE